MAADDEAFDAYLVMIGANPNTRDDHHVDFLQHALDVPPLVDQPRKASLTSAATPNPSARLAAATATAKPPHPGASPALDGGWDGLSAPLLAAPKYYAIVRPCLQVEREFRELSQSPDKRPLYASRLLAPEQRVLTVASAAGSPPSPPRARRRTGTLSRTSPPSM